MINCLLQASEINRLKRQPLPNPSDIVPFLTTRQASISSNPSKVWLLALWTIIPLKDGSSQLTGIDPKDGLITILKLQDASKSSAGLVKTQIWKAQSQSSWLRRLRVGLWKWTISKVPTWCWGSGSKLFLGPREAVWVLQPADIVPFTRTFFDDKHVLLGSPTRVATCSYWALEMWPVQPETLKFFLLDLILMNLNSNGHM